MDRNRGKGVHVEVEAVRPLPVLDTGIRLKRNGPNLSAL